MHQTVLDLIERYKLKQHPEGGYYYEYYRCLERLSQSSLPERYDEPRSFSTAIYYLLVEHSHSCFHRIKSDEIWHFYMGGSMTLVQLFPDGGVMRTVLGPGLEHDKTCVVLQGVWFAAYPNQGSDFSFVGCTVAPGFELHDLEIATRKNLLKYYPIAKDDIVRLTML
ncbi:MAG: cupin domain-containing protein [Chlamydiota bacterium]|nr:cupin domain-containing protein [Chlamydiota bacterium]